MSLFAVLSDWLVQGERWIARLLVLGFVGLITVNVALRYGAGRPIIFAEELAAILLTWLTFIAVSITIHDKAQIGVTLAIDLAPQPIQRLIETLVWLLVAGMLALLLNSGISWVGSPAVEFEQIITTGWPKAPFFLIFPVFCASALLHALGHLTRAVWAVAGDVA